MRNLRQAEADLAQKRTELAHIQIRVQAVTEALETDPGLGRVLGRRLQMDAAARDDKRWQLERLEARELELVREIEGTSSSVDKAKNRLAELHRALKRLSA